MGRPIDLRSILSVDEFAALARSTLSEMAYAYLASGTADEFTLRDNRAAFDRLRILPRVLVDVSHIDTAVTLFGRTHACPILLAPAAYQRLFHPDGELAAVEGANKAGVTLVAATFSNTSIEDMAAASRDPLWFQLYINPDRGFTRDLVQRAEVAGCEALCVCVDVPVNGPRYRELRAGFSLPPGAERANLRTLGAAVAAASHRPAGRNIYAAVRAPNATWADIETIAAHTRMPVLVKGTLHRDDALAALQSGAQGVIVSNHGGRSLDTVPAALDVLPSIVEALASRVPILVDGGIWRGTDVFKAIALGASAVLIGRAFLYAMAVAGPAGIVRAIEILWTELEMTMGFAGRTTLANIGPDSLWRG